MQKETVLVSGGFDPVHIGHLRMFEEAAKLADRLLVIVNNDNFLILLSLIFLVLLLIVHQILTSNENYIFFLIPIITSFIHIFGTDQKKIKNIVLYSLILLCIS